MGVRIAVAGLAAGLLLFGRAHEVDAQFEAPCSVGCALALGVTAAGAATGTVMAVATARGGMSTSHEALRIWGVSFGLIAGSGMLLGGDGGRQRRAVYGAAFVGGATALLAAALASVRETPGSTRLARALIGAAAGALVGGAYGAVTYDALESNGPVPFFSLRIPY